MKGDELEPWEKTSIDVLLASEIVRKFILDLFENIADLTPRILLIDRPTSLSPTQQIIAIVQKTIVWGHRDTICSILDDWKVNEPKLVKEVVDALPAKERRYINNN